ncbi:hypothetical protein VULLAG_LOCUS11882 [Vulpes lagopus]
MRAIGDEGGTAAAGPPRSPRGGKSATGVPGGQGDRPPAPPRPSLCSLKPAPGSLGRGGVCAPRASAVAPPPLPPRRRSPPPSNGRESRPASAASVTSAWGRDFLRGALLGLGTRCAPWAGGAAGGPVGGSWAASLPREGPSAEAARSCSPPPPFPPSELSRDTSDFPGVASAGARSALLFSPRRRGRRPGPHPAGAPRPCPQCPRSERRRGSAAAGAAPAPGALKLHACESGIIWHPESLS